MRDESIIGVIAVLLALLALWAFSPIGRGLMNSHFYSVQKADDATNYKTRREVEDTCRAMISSYESDKIMYEQYKDSERGEERSWANQAKNRANKTAMVYNNFILDNSFVWSENVPSDIRHELEVIQ